MPEVTLLNGALYNGRFHKKGTKLTVDDKRAADWARSGLIETPKSTAKDDKK